MFGPVGRQFPRSSGALHIAGIDQRLTMRRTVGISSAAASVSGQAEIARIPYLGGLHHSCTRTAA